MWRRGGNVNRFFLEVGKGEEKEGQQMLSLLLKGCLLYAKKNYFTVSIAVFKAASRTLLSGVLT